MSLFIKLCLGRQINKRLLLNIGQTVNLRCKSGISKTDRVVITDDGSTVVCWHPEKPFPYECSKPLPEERSQEENSVLKVQNISEIYDVFKPKTEEQTREELMKITCTSKHIWFPKAKKSYQRKPIPRKREYL